MFRFGVIRTNPFIPAQISATFGRGDFSFAAYDSYLTSYLLKAMIDANRTFIDMQKRMALSSLEYSSSLSRIVIHESYVTDYDRYCHVHYHQKNI